MSAALSVPRENAMGRPCYWTYPKDQSRPVSKQKEPESCSPLRNVLWLVQMQNHRPLEAFGRRTHLETRSPGDSGVRQRCGRQKVAEWMEDLGHGSEFARSCTTLRKKIETAVRFGGSVMTGSSKVDTPGRNSMFIYTMTVCLGGGIHTLAGKAHKWQRIQDCVHWIFYSTSSLYFY
ncbi:uncharacterized protein LOC144297599 isoform X2 [Canis aureus]